MSYKYRVQAKRAAPAHNKGLTEYVQHSMNKKTPTTGGPMTIRRARAVLITATLIAAFSGTIASASTTPSDGVAEAQAAVALRTTIPDTIGFDTPLSALPTGATAYYMECGVLQCTDVGDQLELVAPELGVTIVRIPTGDTPETISAAFDRAAADLPDAVLVPALPPDLYQSQLTTLNNAAVPVIAWTLPADELPGLQKIVLNGSQYELNGQLMADWVIADSMGAANTVVFNVPTFAALKVMEHSFADELARLCAHCTYEGVDVQGQDIGSALPGRVVSYLQANPDTNYVFLAFGSMVLGVPEALAAAGLDAKLVSQAGLEQNFEYIQAGQQAVDLTLSHEQLAYAALDIMARALAGDDTSVVPGILPGIFLSADNLDFEPSEHTTWPMPQSFRDQYLALWHGTA